MEEFLTRHGFRVAVLKADSVAPDRREAWVEERVKQGIDVLICHPRLVQTGLDLIDFPTLAWFETDYSVYTMRQASRRSWRIGQKRPVKVVFMAYRNTLQADALKLVAKKLQSSLAVEGELPEDGLAAFGDDGDDLMLALARQIVSGEEETDSKASRWRMFSPRRGTPRPAPRSSWWTTAGRRWRPSRRWLTVNEIGTNGNGHHDAIEHTVELVLDNGHAHGSGNGHGHDSEPAEGQQSLFSWAEFLAEEPAQPKGRNGKPKTASASLFQWALDKEQEREKEPVGAAR